MLSPHAIFEEIRKNDEAFRLLAGDVSLAFVAAIGGILRWPAWKRARLALSAQAICVYERAWGWRRMVNLVPPVRLNALGAPQPAA